MQRSFLERLAAQGFVLDVLALPRSQRQGSADKHGVVRFTPW